MFYSGLMNFKAKHPCPFCETKKNENGDWEVANVRTCGNITEHYENWVEAGSDPNKLMDFFNCKHPPILPHDETKDVPTHLLLAPPSLHLMLGCNYLIEQLGKYWRGMSVWIKEHHLNYEAYQGGCFEGNDVKKFFSLLEVLEKDTPEEFQDFIVCLKEFRNVSQYVLNSSSIHTDRHKHIHNFGAALDNLKAKYTGDEKRRGAFSEIPKFHIIRKHVLDFIDYVKRPLTMFSEQELESSHYRFSDIWEERFKMKNYNDPRYSRFLQKAVVDLLYENI